MTTTSTPAARNADLDAFLPLVASAWNEGELSDLELAAVCLEIIRDPNLDLSCRETLRQWLDASAGQATLRSSKAPSSTSASSSQLPARSSAA
jgi:hypothetical protein